MNLALTPGARLGVYEIVAQIGEGGMGQVYLATDTALGRPVAIKILPEAFASDPERLARFEREAKTLASLNHSHIAAIYAIEKSTGQHALAMELVEGDDLSQRIARGAIPIDEALPIAIQIAEALEAAHEQGIIHRDLKPANIKVRSDGTVKVLDFGLAKAMEPTARSSPSLSMSPTITTPAMTQAGMILGTAAYMSPEQAKGREADRRSDIWAFGCVLYEMLTGTQAFSGEDTAEILAAVVRADPAWHALPADTPTNIRTLLLRCLQKDVKKRMRDAGDIGIELTAQAHASSTAIPSTAFLSRRSLVVGIAGLLLGVSVTGFAVWPLKSAPAAPVSRFTAMLPPGQRLAGLDQTAVAFSPDGRRFAYVATTGGTQQLYLREMDSAGAMPIAGTEGAASPFFSPDGRWVGFFTIDSLKKVPVGGGPAVVLARVENFGRGGSWGNDGTIVFAPSANGGLASVSANGGTVKPLTAKDRLNTLGGNHRFPHHLPSGNALLFTVGTGASWDDARVELLTLGSGERKVLIEGGSDARYLPTGHLVYLRAATLMVVPFDLDRLEVTGSPVAAVTGVLPSTNNTGSAQATIAPSGSLLYVSGGGRPSERTIVLVDRDGTEHPVQLPPRPYRHPRFSRDGRRIVLDIDEGNSSDVWVCDLDRGTLTRLTFDGVSLFPVWTPDGKRLTFAKAGPTNLFWKNADGSGTDERLTTSEHSQIPNQWTPDSQTLAFNEVDPTTGRDIWTLSLGDGRKPQPFLRTPFNEGALTFSPDGHWMAYQSDESGRNEIYTQPFPGPGGKELVSVQGGTEPVWSTDGRELFYRNGDRIMVVALTTRPTLRASKPEALFERPYWSEGFLRDYDIAPDGRRFLMLKESEQVAAATHVTVVMNWFEELKRLVPTK